MDVMDLRRGLLMGEAGVAYEAWDLAFNKNQYDRIDTGVYLFSQDNLNKDFEVVIDDLYGTLTGPDTDTIVCAKHNGNSTGFLIRCNSITTTAYKGTIGMRKDTNNHVTIRRINGVITATGYEITNPAVTFKNEAHNHSLILGCAVDDDGTYYRYATGTIGHIVVRWL